jgi:hypothetical protein
MHVLAFIQSRMQLVNDILGLVIVLAPVGLIYGWHFYFATIRREPPGWRNRISGLSLLFCSVGVLLWPVAMMLAPKADWRSYEGAPRQLHFVYSWERVVLYGLFATLVLCFFGRPRLIVPIAVGCIGTALFWLGSTMP